MAQQPQYLLSSQPQYVLSSQPQVLVSSQAQPQYVVQGQPQYIQTAPQQQQAQALPSHDSHSDRRAREDRIVYVGDLPRGTDEEGLRR